MEITESNTTNEEAIQANTSSNSNAESKKPSHKVQKIDKKKSFTKEQTVAFIAAIEARPILWTKFGPEYIVRKDTAWEEVLEEVKIEGIELSDLKSRWRSLRRKFKECAATLSRETLGHGASIEHEVPWIHFKELTFLYEADDEAELPSTYPEVEELPSAVAEYESSPIYESYIGLEPICEILFSTPSFLMSNTHVSGPVMPATPPSSRRESTSSHQYPCVEDTQLPSNPTQLLNTVHRASSIGGPILRSPNATFCRHILSELRLLPDARSRRLRRLLMQKMYNFMETRI